MDINILCDNKDSWFWKTSNIFLDDLKSRGHNVNLCKQESELINADVSAFISCTKIVTSGGLKKSKSNIVCHPSDLPNGKGFSPIAWEILNNSNEIIFTLFEADEKVDNGKIYFKKSINLIGTELNDEIKIIQADTTYSMILEYIDNYPHNTSYEQEGEETYYPRRTPSDSELDIKLSIESQFNLFRIVDNELYPAFFKYKNRKYVLKIEKEENNSSN